MSTVHAKNALLFALVLLASLPFGAPVILGVALGGALQLLNLRLLERSVAHMLGFASAGQPGAVQALISLRFFALLAICATVLIVLPVDPLAFAIGFSVTVPALLWHGLATAREA